MWHTPLSIAEYARLRDAAQQQAHVLRREAIGAAWSAAGRWWCARWRQALRMVAGALGNRVSHPPIQTGS